MSSKAGARGVLAAGQDVTGPPAGGPGRRYLLISLILSAAGGFADAGTFVLAHSFTGHITGNSILMAVYMTDRRWAEAATCLVAIVAFLVGTAGGASRPHAPDRSACQRLVGPIAVEVALIGSGLACLALAPSPFGRTVFIACLCLALGVQNGVLGKIGSVSFHTTFITGLSTTLIASLVSGHVDPKQRVLPLVIGCFIVGAFAGAFSVSRLGGLGFAVVLAPIALSWLLARAEPSGEQAFQVVHPTPGS